MTNLFHYLNIIGRARNNYVKYSKDPAVKAKSILFGVYSIIMSVVACGVGLLALLFVKVFQTDNFVGIIFGLLFGICFAIGAVSLLLNSLLNLIYQLRLNKRAIGYVAIAVFLLAIIGVGVGAIFIL